MTMRQKILFKFSPIVSKKSLKKKANEKKTVEWKKFSEYGPEIFFSDWEQNFLANVAEADLVISSDKEMPILKLESPFSAVGRMNLENEREIERRED